MVITAHQVGSYVAPVTTNDRTDPVPHYEIRVAGRLAPRWSAWFDGLTVAAQEDGTTVIRGAVVDQSALHGLLQKLRDVGIRIALGAEPRGVVRMLLVRGLRPIVVGIVLGVAASEALSRLMVNQVYGVTTTDPWTFAVVAIVLLVVGAAACLLPARRATQVDPAIALRSE